MSRPTVTIAPVDLGPVLALAAASGYGAADFVGGLGSRRHSSWQIVVVGRRSVDS